MKFDPSPTAIWKKYERDRDYKRSIGLYDRVRRNEAFYLGRQWEGLRVQSLDPLIFNVLRRCVNLFVSMLVSDDVAVRAQPFDMDKDGRQTAHVLERAFASAIERSGVKALGRPLLKNACVDGDACFYMHFDPALETGQAVKGDIAVELIDSTNICFGNAACDEVQRQPYIIIAMRRDAEEVRQEARANGISASDAEAIRPDDSGEYHRYRTSSDSDRVTVLLHMRRTENGIAFCKTTRNAVVMREKVLPYRLYPVTHLCWNRVRGSCHGESPLTEAIPNQIAINKLYSMYVQCIKQVAFPKIVYDMTRFPNGWSNDVGKAIGMRGNPNEAIAAAFRAPDISAQVLQLLKQMMTDTAELMGKRGRTRHGQSGQHLGNYRGAERNSSAARADQNGVLPLHRRLGARVSRSDGRALRRAHARSAERGRRRTRKMHVRLFRTRRTGHAPAGGCRRGKLLVRNHADDDKRSSAGERRYFRPARISGKRTGLSGTRQT